MVFLNSIRCAVTLVRLGQCSKHMQELTKHYTLWKALVNQDFPDQSKTILNAVDGENHARISWKDHYKRLYRKKRRQEAIPDTEPAEPIPLMPLPLVPARPRFPPARPFRGPFLPRHDPPFGPFGPNFRQF